MTEIGDACMEKLVVTIIWWIYAVFIRRLHC